jgi:hypothetical protein
MTEFNEKSQKRTKTNFKATRTQRTCGIKIYDGTDTGQQMLEYIVGAVHVQELHDQSGSDSTKLRQHGDDACH